jgi:hypothetical protein
MEQIYRDQLDNFTDREQIMHLFEQFLHVAQPGQLRLLAIKGNSAREKPSISPISPHTSART